MQEIHSNIKNLTLTSTIQLKHPALSSAVAQQLSPHEEKVHKCKKLGCSKTMKVVPTRMTLKQSKTTCHLFVVLVSHCKMAPAHSRQNATHPSVQSLGHQRRCLSFSQ